MPLPAKETLRTFGDVFELSTRGITYDTISGHPDVFICQAISTGWSSAFNGQQSIPFAVPLSPEVPGSQLSALNSQLIVSPSIPAESITWLEERGVQFLPGQLPTGPTYPGSASYNAVVTDRFIIHNFRYTDPAITSVFDDRELIHVSQGYCRCNLLPLKEDHFITSDEGIFKILRHYSLDVLLVSPEGIRLEGQKNGFIGGAFGVMGDWVFVCGMLDMFPEGNKIRQYLQKIDYHIVELYDGPLVDVGNIVTAGTK